MIQSVNKYPIDEIFKQKDKMYYFIPKYQREYTWSYNEWDNLYTDLQENNEGYFIGSIICINTNDATYPRLEVIDGQQRLTTLCIFLAAIYNKLCSLREEEDTDTLVETTNLKNSLLRNGISPTGLVLVPQIQNNNLDDFNQVMVEAGLIKVADKKPWWAKRKMARCYHHFIFLLEEELKDKTDYDEKITSILNIKEKVLRAMLVKIEVNSASDAYILFESLNNRGTPLTAIDLMKNLIMARAEKAGLSTADCFNQWQILLNCLSDDYATQERFFRQYYNAFKNRLNAPFRTDDKKRDPLGYVATKSNLLNIFERIINRNLNGFLDDILISGKIYSRFFHPDDEDSILKKPLQNLLHVQGVPSYMLLLYLFHDEKRLQLDDKKMATIIDLLTIYFVRRNTTDYPVTRDITRIFMDIIAGIDADSNMNGDKVYAYIKDNLREHCAPDEQFEKSLSGDIYKDNSGVARYLLCALAEKSMTSETWTNLWQRNDRNVFVWTIEHIFPEGDDIPQDWVDMIAGGDPDLAKQYLNDYVHKLGNLTITGYNSALSNMSFEKKRDRQDKKTKRYIGYKNGLDINKEIAQKDEWTIDDIKSRTDELVKELLVMYKFPE
jgi:uncharacterized protein with ParB-like and HNH nuclease domain